MRTMSAPMSERIMPQNGPGPIPLKFNDPNALKWPHDERSLCAARTRAANWRRCLRWQDTAMTPRELRIEPAGADDAAEVIELIHRVFDEYGFIWDPEDEFWDLLADEFPYLAPRGAMWVSRDAAGRVVGSIAAELLDAQTVELHRLYLDAELRGAGQGAAIAAARRGLGARARLRAGRAMVGHAVRPGASAL